MAIVRTLVDRAILSHWITARHCAPMMVEANRGLIVEVTDGSTSPAIAASCCTTSSRRG